MRRIGIGTSSAGGATGSETVQEAPGACASLDIAQVLPLPIYANEPLAFLGKRARDEPD